MKSMSPMSDKIHYQTQDLINLLNNATAMFQLTLAEQAPRLCRQAGLGNEDSNAMAIHLGKMD